MLNNFTVLRMRQKIGRSLEISWKRDGEDTLFNRIIMIEYQLPRGIMKYSKCPTYPLHFYATQIINTFLNWRISANHDKEEGHSANSEILIKGIFRYNMLNSMSILLHKNFKIFYLSQCVLVKKLTRIGVFCAVFSMTYDSR